MFRKQKIISKRQIYRRVKLGVQTTLKSFQQVPLSTSEDSLVHFQKPEISINNSNPLNNFESNLSSQERSHDTSTVPNSDTYQEDEHIGHLRNNLLLQSSELTSSKPENNINDVNMLKSDLINWTLLYNIPRVATTKLLHILSIFFPELPLDSRTLLHTPINSLIKKIPNGEYIHFGLLNGILICLNSFENVSLLFPEKIVMLSFNIDDLPLFHSSSQQLWPILALLSNDTIKNVSPFAVGIFCGKTKPSSLESYLEDFINDLLELTSKGFTLNQQHFSVVIHKFTCDAPARAYIKCVKSHGGYSSCDKCIEIGEYYDGRVILRGTNARKRTDKSFVDQLDEDHHMGISPLIKLPLGLVTQFPNDYMHSVCLGVVRKLLYTWISGSLSVRLCSRDVTSLSEHLLSLKIHVPLEINRKPRELSELARWKASELRSFLIYLGPLVLKNILHTAMYEHFLLLHCGITILLSKKHIEKIGTDLANEFISVFVNHCEKLYSKKFYVYNVHSLCHLSIDVDNYGPLDNFSAFCFENYLGKLKKIIKKPNQPLQQIYRRQTEINQSVSVNKISNVQYLFEHNGPVFSNFRLLRQYKKLVCVDYVLTIYDLSVADCYCMHKSGIIIEIHNFGITHNNLSIIIENNSTLIKTFFIIHSIQVK